MNTQDLVSNIAVNMGRLARWVSEGKNSRVAAVDMVFVSKEFAVINKEMPPWK